VRDNHWLPHRLSRFDYFFAGTAQQDAVEWTRGCNNDNSHHRKSACASAVLLGVFWLVYKVIAFAGRYCSFTARMGSRHGGKHITDDAPVPPRYGSLLLLLNFYDRA
jgi:hypothetical protein